MKNYFYVDELSTTSSWIIRINTDLINTKGATGSLNVLMARVCGVSYGDFLRYCRSDYGAELRGKKGYPYPLFKDKREAQKLASFLCKRFELITII